jgi:Rrf2 family protein
VLSQTVEYALRATVYIARRAPDAVRVAEVADAVDAPRNYLAKILGQLARAGLLDSSRGAAGGFRLARPADDVALADVVGVFEGMELRGCLLGTGPCGTDPSCTAHSRWAPIALATTCFFAGTTIGDLLSSHPSPT